MQHHTSPDYFALAAHALCLLYGVGMAVFLIRQDAKTKGSYLTRREGKTMLFRQPLSRRRGLLAIAGFFALMILAITVSGRHIPLIPSTFLIVGFFLVDAPLFLAFLVYLAGPNDIRLDGDRRTYERTVGFPWRPTIHRGTFEDVKGVCVSANGQAVLLTKKRIFPYKGVVLSGSGTKAAAQILAEEVCREFGFPIVPYPKNR